MEEELLTEEKTEKIPDDWEKNTDDELTEEVRAKYGEKKKSQRITEIFTVQMILSVLLVLIFAIINILDVETAEWFINEFKIRSMGETEQIIKNAVSYAVNIIK